MVQVTFDSDEIAELGALARAALDASVVAPDLVEERTANNAVFVVGWADRIQAILDKVNSGGGLVDLGEE